MSVRSSRSAAEAAQRQHPRLRAFHDAMANSMQAFEKAREWPDLIKCLARVNKVLSKFSHIDHVPMTLTVTKRLAQCLNQVLPGGVHLKTLETYRVILERIGPQHLVQDLSLYSTGLFPLMVYASSRVRPELLEIYEKYYLPLGKGLLPCLSGFFLALLPGLEEGSGEIYTRTLTLLVSIRNQTSAPQFALAFWKCILQRTKFRGAAMHFIIATIPPSGSAELAEYLPIQRSIAIEAMVATLHDDAVLTQRSMFDLMISHFPLVEGIFTKKELTYLLQATLPVILRRETSVNRRFYSWLLSKGGSDELPTTETLEMSDCTLEMLITSLYHIMKLRASSAEESTQPFNIARTLLERDEIRMSTFLPRISFCLIDYAYSYDEESVLKSAQFFFNQADLSQVWTALIAQLDSSLNEIDNRDVSEFSEDSSLLSRSFGKIHSIDLIDFALDFLPIHPDSDFSEKQIVPIIIDTGLRALYRISWKNEDLAMTRLITFTLKLLSSRFNFEIPLAELENFLISMLLPLPNDFDPVVGEVELLDHSERRTESQETANSIKVNDQLSVQCVDRLFELYHYLLCHGHGEKRKHIIRFSEYMLKFAVSPTPQLSCIGFEAWIRIHQQSLKDADQADCFQLAQQLWYLLDSKFGDEAHKRVASLWIRLYDICPNICEAVVADAILCLSPDKRSDEYNGYERFARLWRFLCPLDIPERPSRCSGNCLSLMLDAIDDQRTPLRLIALDFIRVSAEYIHRMFDPLLLILLCPSTLRLSPSLCYVHLYDTDLIRHCIWRLQAIFCSVHRQLVFSSAARQTVRNPTILSLLKRQQRPGSIPIDQRFSLPDPPTYIDIVFWCALRFVQGQGQHNLLDKDVLAIEDVRLAAVDLLVQLVTASAMLFNDNSTNLLAIAERIGLIGTATLGLLSFSIDSKNSNLQVSLLRLLRHVIIDSAALQSATYFLNGANFASTLLCGIQQAYQLKCEQYLLKHWIGFIISILPHLHNSLGSVSFSVLTVLCEQIRKTSVGAHASSSVLLYGIREITHYCLLRKPTPLTLSSQLSTVNATSASSSTVLGYLGGIFSSSAIRNESETFSEVQFSKDTTSSANAIRGILPIVLDVATIYIWALLPEKPSRKASVTSVSSFSSNHHTVSFDVVDLIVSFLNPLFVECPTLIATALLSSWDSHARQNHNDMSSWCEMIDTLPAATPDCILSTLTSIFIALRDSSFVPNSSATSIPNPSETAMLHFLDQFIHNCKNAVKLTDLWPKMMQLQKVVFSGTSNHIPPALWLLSTVHEIVLRTNWHRLDAKSVKDIRDMVQHLFTLCSNFFVKGSSEVAISSDLPKPRSLSYLRNVEDENEEDGPPVPSWLKSDFSLSSPLTFRLLALRSVSNITPDIFSFLWGGNSAEDEERACSMLGLLLPYIFLNIDNRSIDQLDYAAVAAAFLASFSVNKFKFSLKTFKKDCWNAFQHNDFFDGSVDGLSQWRKIMSRIVTEDPALLTEQLMGRPINPQVLMFTSHKTDVLVRARQLKRLSFMIHAGRIDEYSRHLPAIAEKLIESLKLEDAVILHAQVLFCIRILLARVSPENLNLIWPVVLMEVISVLDESCDLDLILEACKFVDLALVLLPSQFHLYQWMFIVDRLALFGNSDFEQGPVLASNSEHSAKSEQKPDPDESEIIKLCNYNSFNCFQPHVRYLGRRLRTEPQFSDGNASSDSRRASGADLCLHSSLQRNAALRRPLLIMRRIMSASQLRQFHFEVSAHISSQNTKPAAPDLDFIDQLLLSDFVSFGDGYKESSVSS